MKNILRKIRVITLIFWCISALFFTMYLVFLLNNESSGAIVFGVFALLFFIFGLLTLIKEKSSSKKYILDFNIDSKIIIAILLSFYCFSLIYILLSWDSVVMDTTSNVVVTSPTIEDGNVADSVEDLNNPNSSQSTYYAKIADVVGNDILYGNIISAFDDINANIALVSDFEQIADWVSGERYTCKYTINGISTTLTIYCFSDGTVSSINTALASPYEIGYEPIDIANFTPAYSTYSQFTTLVTMYIEKYVTYPSTMKIEGNYGMSRCYDVYYFSNTLSCENALGIRSEYPYKVAVFYNGVDSSLVYVQLDDEIFFDLRSEYEVEKTAIQSDATTESISIIANTLGTHGQVVETDGFEFIEYFVPIGKYEIKNNGKTATLYLVSDELYKNSDGWLDNKIYETIKLTSYEETATIEILENQHIQVVSGTNIVLSEIKE